MRLRFILTSLFFIPLLVKAQLNFGKMGTITGSFETNSQLYVRDDITNAVFPQDRIGSNNYLKLDYRVQKFSAGIQYEAYLPSLQGYPFFLDEAKLVQKYFSFQDQKFGLTVGNFHEQFGSGLVFRSWENRQIGINNAMEGVNLSLKPLKQLEVKFVYGKQRKNFDNSEGTIRGADLNWQLVNKTVADKYTSLRFGASFVSRYQQYTGPDPDFKPTVNAFSSRVEFQQNNSSYSIEYVAKSKDQHLVNNQLTNIGKALLINYGYSKKNIGFTLNMRRLENMDFRTDRNADQGLLLVNYIPALTKQHEYYLANIYVYNAQSFAEIGGQADLLIKFPKASKLGGKYGMDLALNYSRYHSLQIRSQTVNSFESSFFGIGSNLFFSDLNVVLRKKFSTKWSSSLFLQQAYYNKSVVEGGNYQNIKSTVIVSDILFRYKSRKSIRTQLQHLSTRQDKKNWIGLQAEWTFAPHYSIFLSDMYNYGDPNSKVHYFNGGGSYSVGAHKLLLNFGRQRAGLICVGGVCRLVPAATGLNLSFTSMF